VIFILKQIFLAKVTLILKRIEYFRRRRRNLTMKREKWFCIYSNQSVGQWTIFF